MADILLKYLTDLPSAADAESSDLMHISQAGNDRSITLDVLASAIFNIRYPVGKVEWFANDVNPNTIWTGSTWARLPGAGKTIRLANGTGSDALQTGGSDTLSILEANLPAHSHPVDLPTDQYDYGTKKATSTGSGHRHQIIISGQTGLDGSGNDLTTSGGSQASFYTQTDGAHEHSVPVGAHAHQVKGDTGKTGAGTPVNITNSFIKLAGWYRTA
ncbi:hypothetical protein ACLKAI_003298 [Escherichia coli]